MVGNEIYCASVAFSDVENFNVFYRIATEKICNFVVKPKERCFGAVLSKTTLCHESFEAFVAQKLN